MIYSALAVGPLESFGTPVWKPFLNRRGTPFKCLMRPVPVVFLRLAFSPQLSVYLLAQVPTGTPFAFPRIVLEDVRYHIHCLILAAGYPHDEQVCFWMWRDRRPEV